MGKLIHDVRFKVDDDDFEWMNRAAAEEGMPRRLFLVRQFKFARKVHDEMKQQRAWVRKRSAGVFGGRSVRLSGEGADYVCRETQQRFSAQQKYSLSEVICDGTLSCPFAAECLNARRAAGL